MEYVIRKEDDDQLFWSSNFGWVETGFEDYFSFAERISLNLPLGGIWVITNY